MLSAIALVIAITVAAAFITSRPSGVSLPACPDGGQALAAPSVTATNSGQMFCGPYTSNAAIVLSTDHHWWLVDGPRRLTNAIPAIMVNLTSRGQQILVQLPPPCGIVKLTPMRVPKAILADNTPLHINPAPGYQIRDYFAGSSPKPC